MEVIIEKNEIAFGTCECLGQSMRVEAIYNDDEFIYICPYCKQLVNNLKIYRF